MGFTLRFGKDGLPDYGEAAEHEEDASCVRRRWLAQCGDWGGRVRGDDLAAKRNAPSPTITGAAMERV